MGCSFQKVLDVLGVSFRRFWSVMLKKMKSRVLWRPTRPFRTNTQKMECKSRKSRNTWSNRQIWPWNAEWSRAKANRVLPREHTGHSKHPLPATQEKTTHGHHQMVNTEIRLIIFFASKDGDALYSQQKQDWKLTVALPWTCYCKIQAYIQESREKH